MSLDRINCSGNKLTSLDLGNNQNLIKLECCRNQLQRLNLSNNPKLTEIDLTQNQLTALDFSKCGNLEKLNCSHNNINDIPLIADKGRIKILKMDDNTKNEQHLTCFREYVNLRHLSVVNSPFYGSLEPLKNLTKLKYLNISRTNIDRGLEYLPISIEEFYCDSRDRDNKQTGADTNVKRIKQMLISYNTPPYNDLSYYYYSYYDRHNHTNYDRHNSSDKDNLSKWRRDNISLVRPVNEAVATVIDNQNRQ